MKTTSLVMAALVLAVTAISFGGPTFYTDSASFNAASQISVVEDFESASPKNTPIASYTNNGITYTGLAGTPFANVYIAKPGFTNFGVPVTESTVLTANGDEDFSLAIQLNAPATAIGFDTYLNQYGPATITVFGASGQMGTYTLLHDYTQVGFFGVTSTDPITMLQWTTVNGRAINTGIDNVQVGNVVPAPGALFLGMIGTGVVGYIRRRRTV